MAIFTKKTPWEKEWQDLLKKEAKFASKRKEGPTSVLMKKLDRVVPQKLSGTLNTAFFKAFQLVFEKGTGIIEKTYNKDKKETDFKVNTYASELTENRKTAKEFTRQVGRRCKSVDFQRGRHRNGAGRLSNSGYTGFHCDGFEKRV